MDYSHYMYLRRHVEEEARRSVNEDTRCFQFSFTQCNCTQRRCRVCDCGCAPIRLIVGADASYIAAIAVHRHCNTSVEYSVNIYLWRLEALWKPGFKGPRSTGQESWNFTINAMQCHATKSTNSNELRGMTVTSGVVTISKDSGNLIGISIGGGAPLCPCLYIVQVGQCWYTYLQNKKATIGVAQYICKHIIDQIPD